MEKQTIQSMWNEKFSRKGYLYGTNPNAFLASQLERLAAGSKILFLGEGEGRNACYAAAKGFDATALDASDVGLRKMETMACELGVSIKTLHTDLEHWESEGAYDVVMASFLHLMEPLRMKAFREAMHSLRPGGRFIAEFFSTRQLPRDSGGPKMIDLLYTTDSLREVFAVKGCEIEMLEEVVDTLDEGVGHQGEADLIRIIVKRL
jgi:2-polyprenyl-3-methyl-5-hydroxy-6-metoxy-1,4-benzoquinol methylase